jgi:hypothetical protein
VTLRSLVVLLCLLEFASLACGAPTGIDAGPCMDLELCVCSFDGAACEVPALK